MIRYVRVPGFLLALLGILLLGAPVFAQDSAQQLAAPSAGGSLLYLEADSPPVQIQPIYGLHSTTGAVSYQGGVYVSGVGDVGVEPAPKVYLVLWGAQWNYSNGDPFAESRLLKNFYQAIGGNDWLSTVTAYCEGVPVGTETCGPETIRAGNPAHILAGIWADTGTRAPTHPTQSQVAYEAVRAAHHFRNITPQSNASVQYVIATANGFNSDGFGTNFCAYHSYKATPHIGNIAYTNLPYMPDAGAACSGTTQNLTQGITIVAGAMLADTITDPFPSGGWLDADSNEIGFKCAWQELQDLTLSFGTVKVQELWLNSAGTQGACVIKPY